MVVVVDMEKDKSMLRRGVVSFKAKSYASGRDGCDVWPERLVWLERTKEEAREGYKRRCGFVIQEASGASYRALAVSAKPDELRPAQEKGRNWDSLFSWLDEYARLH